MAECHCLVTSGLKGTEPSLFLIIPWTTFIRFLRKTVDTFVAHVWIFYTVAQLKSKLNHQHQKKNFLALTLFVRSWKLLHRYMMFSKIEFFSLNMNVCWKIRDINFRPYIMFVIPNADLRSNWLEHQ